jgi:hypothetical protein
MTRRIGLLLLAFSFGASAQHMDVGSFELHFAGNFDFSKRFGDRPERSTFALGAFDTMAHAHLSKEFSVLSEAVFEGRPSGEWGFDLERLQLNYEPRKWFRVSAGRFHTPLGYWNTAHHHARWMSTSIDSPQLMRYEDGDGPLPMHTIGAMVHGRLELGPDSSFEYDAGIGNGRGFATDPPQNFLSVHDAKAVLAGVHLKVGGLRFGVAGYLDRTTVGSETGPLLREQIVVADATYLANGWELIAEGAALRHDVQGAGVAVSRGGYVQVGYQLTDLVKPYARAERFIRPAEEIFLPTPNLTEGLAGIRLDPIPSVALKVETGWSRADRIEGVLLRSQLAWLF